MTDWISVKDRLPEVEERVLLLTVNDVGDKKFYHITIGMYEDGTVNAEYSKYSWDESAYNDGYACGMEQGIEAERSRKG